MPVEWVIKRRMLLLKDIATRARGRHDIALPLAEVAPSLVDRSGRFWDKKSPDVRPDSDLAYDFNTLLENELIELTHLTYEHGSAGEAVGKNPAVRITPRAVEVVAEFNKSWLRKAIDKQPMTFLQVIVTILISLVTGVGGWLIGRYVTPASTCPSQPETKQSSPVENPPAKPSSPPVSSAEKPHGQRSLRRIVTPAQVRGTNTASGTLARDHGAVTILANPNGRFLETR